MDIPSGIQTPLTNFNHRFANLVGYLESKIPGGFVPYFVFLSPDGKWVFWVGGPFAGDGNLGSRWGDLSLDGNQQIIWNSVPEIPAYPWGAWMSDNQHWAGLTFDSYASFLVIYSLKVPNAVRKISLPQASSRSLRLIGFTFHGNAIATCTVGDGISNGELFTFPIDGKIHPIEKHAVPLPKGARVDELVLSKQRNRLAWRLSYYHDMPNSNEYSIRTEFWVSNLDGSHFYALISDEKMVTYVGSKLSDFPQGIQWLPDGKGLSFLYQDALWTIPVE